MAAKKDAAHEPFLASIYAALDDDAPRLVYADWLLERGDPRGALIAIQCEHHRTGTISEEAAREEKRLVALHGQEWLGPLAPLVAKSRTHFTRFSRGFPSELYAQWRAKSAAIVADRAAQTLEAVRGDVGPFVTARLPLLRSIAGFDFDRLRRLSELPFESAIERIDMNPGWVNQAQSAVFAKLEARVFSGVRELRCNMDPRSPIDEVSVAWILDSWIARRVRILRLEWPAPAEDAWSELAERPAAGKPSTGVLRAFMRCFAAHPNIERMELSALPLCDPILRRHDGKLELSLLLGNNAQNAQVAALLAFVDSAGWRVTTRSEGPC